MTTRRKEHRAIWDDFLKLANNDDKLVRAAALRATDAMGRICLQTLKRHILNTTNPALLVTIDAAEEFIRAVGCDDRAIDLPHLHRVYELAESDLGSPTRIFNDAVNFMKHGILVEDAIDYAVTKCETRPKLH